MKNSITLFIMFFLFPFIAFSQEWKWGIGFGGTEYEEPGNIVTKADGVSYVTGNFKGTSTFGDTNLIAGGKYDFFLAKINPDGEIVWVIKSNGADTEFANEIALDSEGNIFVTGWFSGAPNSISGRTVSSRGGNDDYDIYVAKYNPEGQILWVQTLGSNEGDLVRGITVNSLGQPTIIGNFSSTIHVSRMLGDGEYDIIINTTGTEDVFIATLHNNGTLLHARVIGGNGNDYGGSISIDKDGNYLVSGNFSGNIQVGGTLLTNAGLTDIFLVKYSSNLDFLWAKNYGGLSHDNSTSIALDHFGNIFLTGSFENTTVIDSITLTSKGVTDIFIAKFNQTGRVIWAKQMGDVNYEFPKQIIVGGQLNIYLYGYHSRGSTIIGDSLLYASNENNLFLVKLDPLGNISDLWAIGDPDFPEEPGGISLDNQNHLYITGSQGSPLVFGNDATPHSGQRDIFIAKLTITNERSVYTFTGNGPWSNPDNWLNKIMPPNPAGENDSILINTLPDSICILDVQQKVEKGGVIWVSGNSDFIIPSDIGIPPIPPIEGSFTDTRDNKTYTTKNYNGKVWMTMNLNYNMPESIVYDNDPSNAAKFGRLYDWDQAMTACPSGWHLPSKEDWESLRNHIASAAAMRDTLFWLNPATQATNSSGFNGRPGGMNSGNFEAKGEAAVWWTSTLGSPELGVYHWAISFWLGGNYGGSFFEDRKWWNEAVRCVKN